MTRTTHRNTGNFRWLCTAVLGLGMVAPRSIFAQPPAGAVAAFQAYSRVVEKRIAAQHTGAANFLLLPADTAALRRGDVLIDRVHEPNAPAAPDGAMFSHWRGTAFIPHATAADFARVMRDYNGYDKYFAPQVVSSHRLTANGDHYTASMRVKQQHVITVVMDTTYDVNFGALDRNHGYSFSQSTRVDEIADPGARGEHALSPAEEHGFLWALNTWWSYEERDGGLFVQIESLSLSRAVPHGLGWLIGPYVESVPRESLEFTLRSACNAMHHD